ncbi:MmgE/PrpD family protein [Pseudomonas quasicaspiana]|uniref:MmgE/PrpD family protein n=1 Tax=Pseudomonas quasicaspiana TaxID=2829821 RepID=UPI001E577AF2|nr:MmgE/PrpD family protein [Pseudomonas quasicaspiana]MCD5979104.1 MmgE/PrpD family protein [Pseudomonas quasicaspiana]
MSLYSFIQQFELAAAPLETRKRIETCLLDIIGVAAAARDNHTSHVLKEFAVAHYPAATLSSRLWFDGRPVHPLGAAYAGGFSVDSLDAHEGHFTSKGHAGATVVPAIIALIDAFCASGKNISGEEMLCVLTIGYETALRAGRALMATAAQYHASGAFAGIGVVCAGARLLKLDEQTFRHALGIAEYFGPRCPMMRVVDYPSMLRDAHGAGAHAGISALLMAQAGVTGAPAETVELLGGLPYWQGLGESWEIDEQYFKPWPVCRWAQPALTAMTQLMSEHPEIAPENIETIQIETFHESVRLQGHFPKNADEAQYALAFPVAALVARGQVTASEVTGTAIDAPDILAVSKIINIAEASDLSARFPEEILSRVTVQLKDGRCISSPTTSAKGDPANPMSAAEFIEKYRLFSEQSLGVSRSRLLEQAVASLAEKPDCEGLLNLLLSPCTEAAYK